jgi:biofilm PGA synthesis N-glycosyltransferase PgaC
MFAALWAALSLWVDRAWAADLGGVITYAGAWIVICGIAVVPGYLNAQLLASLVVDRPPTGPIPTGTPDLTVLIAAFDEEARISDSVERVLAQEYPGWLEVIVIDDGSTDRTKSIVEDIAARDSRLRIVDSPHKGKAHALNLGLSACRTELVCTVDADTHLTPQALIRIVARLLISPPDTAAVAGSIQVRNREGGFLARLQHFDYYLSIASIKRQQALLQGTLVAQGAFSLYRAEVVAEVGGWPDMLGEDIVLTWGILRRGLRCVFEPTAIAYTEVPTRLSAYLRQRQRWSRGMIEGLRLHGVSLVTQRRMVSHSIANNFLMPYLDFTYSIAIPLGLVEAVRGDFLIVGPLTLAVMPVNLFVIGFMYRGQRRAHDRASLARPRRDFAGFLCFLLAYHLITAPAACSGYVAEAAGVRKRW